MALKALNKRKAVAPKSNPNGRYDMISCRNNWIEYRINFCITTYKQIDKEKNQKKNLKLKFKNISQIALCLSNEKPIYQI